MVICELTCILMQLVPPLFLLRLRKTRSTEVTGNGMMDDALFLCFPLVIYGIVRLFHRVDCRQYDHAVSCSQVVLVLGIVTSVITVILNRYIPSIIRGVVSCSLISDTDTDILCHNCLYLCKLVIIISVGCALVFIVEYSLEILVAILKQASTMSRYQKTDSTVENKDAAL